MDADIVIRVVLALTVLAAAIYLGNLAAEKLSSGEKPVITYGTLAPLPSVPSLPQTLPPNFVTSSSPPPVIPSASPSPTSPVNPPPSLPPSLPSSSIPPVNPPIAQPTPSPTSPALPSTSTPPPQTSGEPWATIVDWDFPGDDLSRFGSATATSCRLACAEHTGCAAAAFDHKLDVCYLKNSLSAQQPILPGDRTTFLKPVATMKFSPHANTSLPDADDLYVVQSSTSSACGQLCNLSEPCAGATYYEDGTRRCRLKRTASVPSSYSGRVSFF
jgi:PAN domain-containing protein